MIEEHIGKGKLYRKFEIRYSENYGGDVLFLKSGEDFPTFGADPKTCKHKPGSCQVYFEREHAPPRKGMLHGWFCALCGELVQVG